MVFYVATSEELINQISQIQNKLKNALPLKVYTSYVPRLNAFNDAIQSDSLRNDFPFSYYRNISSSLFEEMIDNGLKKSTTKKCTTSLNSILIVDITALQSIRSQSEYDEQIALKSQILCITDLNNLLSQITMNNSCLDFKWEFEFKEYFIDQLSKFPAGWLVWVKFQRPDVHTGEISYGRGREEVIEYGSSETRAVMTCWVLIKMIIEHELLEAFKYKGKTVFYPHTDINKLISINDDKEMNAISK